MRLYLYIAAAVLIIGAFGATYLYGRSAGANVVRLEWEQANREQREAEAEQANDAATKLEKDRAKTRTVYRTITQTVDRIVDRPVYRDVCLDDDGLRLSNAALVGATTPAGEPADRVRTPDAAAGRLGGSGSAETGRGQ